MTNKQIAERVAKELGATKVSKKTVEEYAMLGLLKPHKKDEKYWDFEFTELPFHLCKQLELEDVIFSWPVTGMMIEHLQEKGWLLNVYELEISFRIPLPYLDRERDYEESTHEYNVVKEHGYHLAIAKAFLEAVEIMEGEDD